MRPRSVTAVATPTNYPLVSLGRTRQQQRYEPDQSQWQAALEHNSRAVGVEIRESTIANAGNGCFARRSFAAGDIIGHVWGKFVTEEQWVSICMELTDPTQRDGEEDYVEPVGRGVWRAVAVPDQPNGITHLLGSRQCPMVYINEHRKRKRAINAVFDVPSYRFDATNSDHTYIPVKATRNIAQGEEMFVQYHFDKPAWKLILKRMRDAQKSAAEESQSNDPSDTHSQPMTKKAKKQ